MAWTTPTTWTAGMVPGATEFNEQLRDNFNYVFNGGDTWSQDGWFAGSTTETTFQGAFSATGISNNGRALVVATFIARTENANTAYFRLSVNGTGFGNATTGQYKQTPNATYTVTLVGVATGIGVGTYTAIVEYRAAAAGNTAIIRGSGNTIALTEV